MASPFWDVFTHSTAAGTNSIARNGYQFVVDSRVNIAFFPVYPMLTRYVGRLFGTYHAAYYFGGIVVSWLSFIGAMVVAVPPRAPRRARGARRFEPCCLSSVFPFSYFFGEVYSESTSCSSPCSASRLSHATMDARRPGGLGRDRDARAGHSDDAGARVDRVAVRPADIEGSRVGRRRTRARARRIRLVLRFRLLVERTPVRLGDSDREVELPPGRRALDAARSPRLALADGAVHLPSKGSGAFCDALYGVNRPGLCADRACVWYRLGAGYALFMLLSLWLPLSSGATEGMGGYCSVLFPAFIWLATIRSRWISTALVVWSALALSHCLRDVSHRTPALLTIS